MTASTPGIRSLPLIEVIYKAAVTPDLWNEFLKILSDELGGLVLGMNLEVPGVPAAGLAFRLNSPEHFGQIFADYVRRGEIPWDLSRVASTHFHRASDLFPDAELPATDFYRDYMQPQNLFSPLGLVMGRVRGEIVAAMGIYPRIAGRRLSADDCEMLDLLAPHLSQAYTIHRRLRSHERYFDAVAEVGKRLPTGVLFIGGAGTILDSNRAADRILALNDGLAMREGRPCATSPGGHLGFESALREVLRKSPTPEDASQVLRISRPSGHSAFTVLMERLSTASDVGYAREVVAVIFVSDAEQHHDGAQDRIAELYGLTLAESELTMLLCRGNTLDEIAVQRGVTQHTVRSQIKKVFSKTGTSRQADLVRLVVTGVGSLRAV